MRAPGQHSRQGYTLLEIILVLALILILASISTLPMLSMLADARQSAAGDCVRARLADARANAMAESRPWKLAFIPNTGIYQLAPEDSSEWDNTSTDVVEKEDVIRDELPKDVVFSLNQEDILNNQHALPAGSSWETIAIYVPEGHARDDVTVYFGKPGLGPNRAVLRGLTGSVSIETFNLKVDQ
jgi:prepilin-type N-terminal cleavage/methylation domain-containing protein